MAASDFISFHFISFKDTVEWYKKPETTVKWFKLNLLFINLLFSFLFFCEESDHGMLRELKQAKWQMILLNLLFINLVFYIFYYIYFIVLIY